MFLTTPWAKTKETNNMPTATRMISSPIDEETLELLDAFCAKVHRGRAAVMRGLLYALLIEGKQNIFSEWRAVQTGEDTGSAHL